MEKIAPYAMMALAPAIFILLGVLLWHYLSVHKKAIKQLEAKKMSADATNLLISKYQATIARLTANTVIAQHNSANFDAVTSANATLTQQNQELRDQAAALQADIDARDKSVADALAALPADPATTSDTATPVS